MRLGAAWSVGLGLLALGALVAARSGSAEAAEPELARSCFELGGGLLRNERLEIRRDGRVPDCAEQHRATTLFVELNRVLDRLTPQFTPGFVTVELVAATGDRPIRARAEARSLLVQAGYVRVEQSVWLHELAHLIGHGARPKSRAARRVTAAIDEAAADYFAAAVAGSARVGGELTTVRDLQRPPPIADEAWALLAIDGFDPHRFGWGLAALLWQAEPRPGPLLDCLLRALSGPALGGAETPAAVFEALEGACPEPSRQTLRTALGAWAPHELFRAASP